MVPKGARAGLAERVRVLAQVLAGREDPAGAGEHHGADAVIARGLGDGGQQRLLGGHPERGGSHRDRRDRPVGGIGHRPWCASTRQVIMHRTFGREAAQSAPGRIPQAGAVRPERTELQMVLGSYVNGSWTSPSAEGAPLLDAVTGEQVTTISSGGIDMRAALDYGRRVVGRRCGS